MIPADAGKTDAETLFQPKLPPKAKYLRDIVCRRLHDQYTVVPSGSVNWKI